MHLDDRNAALNTGVHPWRAEETNSLQTLRPEKTKPARILFKDTADGAVAKDVRLQTSRQYPHDADFTTMQMPRGKASENRT